MSFILNVNNSNENENEISTEKIIDIFQDLNRIGNFDKNELIQNLNNIYNIYDNIKENDDDPDIPYTEESDNQLIAKMIFYNKKCFNFIPRKIQIISLLYFIRKDDKKGLIQQINTGEGKSIIISFLAVYNAKKKNKKIDILTSSPILAKRDALLFKKFYSYFNLTVSYTNSHNTEVKENNKYYTHDSYDCYKADIVYGDALSFEGDILRTTFMGIKGRGDIRKFDCIIIDEIDNIALDNLKNTTELLDCFHGYKFLEYIYLFIFKKLKEITENKDENDVLENRDNIINNLISESKNEFKDLKKLKEKNIYIPEHLQEYIHYRLDDWCESAFTAKYIYHLNENYVINTDNEFKIKVISPIDFYNTGVTQENSVWSGLHQFLQIYQKLMITEENLSSCYMSNLSFFNKYILKDKDNNIIENNIYGLTGTIGSQYNKETLKELYQLNMLIIPPFKESKLKIEKSEIINLKNKNNKDPDEQWAEKIENKIIDVIGKGRAVLVIFQYINQAIKMDKRLKNKKLINKNSIILYLRSDSEQGKFLDNMIKPKDIILSTNLCGRGTDIRISKELNLNGGLHVILTYEPFNKRIERQAFGRAGRKGENGSAGKIIRSHMTEEEAINEIDKREKGESDFLLKVYKYKIEVFEKIFDRFSQFLKEKLERTNDEILLLDLKERWACFLIENGVNNIEKKYKKDKKSIDSDIFKNIESKYNKFEDELNDYNYGFDLYFKLNFKKIYKKTENIIKSYNNKKYEFKNGLYLNKSKDINRIKEAIKMCPDLCLGGYMLIILEKINTMKNAKYLKDKNESIKEIYSDMNNLINKIKNLVKQFEYYQTIIGYLGYNKDNLELAQQNIQKKNLMERILELMKVNKEYLQDYEKRNFSNKLIVKKKDLKTLIKNSNMSINESVKEYFKEYGLVLFALRTEQINNETDDKCKIY